jgi:hypothetical protein
MFAAPAPQRKPDARAPHGGGPRPAAKRRSAAPAGSSRRSSAGGADEVQRERAAFARDAERRVQLQLQEEELQERWVILLVDGVPACSVADSSYSFSQFRLSWGQ